MLVPSLELLDRRTFGALDGPVLGCVINPFDAGTGLQILEVQNHRVRTEHKVSKIMLAHLRDQASHLSPNLISTL